MRASSPASCSAAGRISAQWNGAETGSGTARRAALLLGALDRPIDGAGVPGDDGLLGRVEVRRGDYAPSASRAARQASATASGSRPRDGGHGALPLRNRRLHEASAGVDEADRVFERQRFGRDERGVLAEAVARHERGRDRRALLECAQQGDAGGEDGGLLHLGPAQLLLGALEAQLGEREAERAVRGLEDGAGRVRRLAGVAPMPTSWEPCPGKRSASKAIPRRSRSRCGRGSARSGRTPRWGARGSPHWGQAARPGSESA